MTGHYSELGSYASSLYLRSFLRRHFAGKPAWRHEISAVFSGQTGCQPRIPVQGHGSWVPSIVSLSKDVFERRTSTGSGLFSFLDSGFA